MTDKNLPAKKETVTSAIGEPLTWTPEEKNIIKTSVASKLSEPEFKWFMAFSSMVRLNPLLREIHPIPFNDKDGGPRHLVFQTSIFALISRAEDTGLFEGFTETEFTVRDKETQERQVIPMKLLDPASHDIISCTVGLRRKDWREPVYITCMWNDFAPPKGGPRWKWEYGKGAAQLQKCVFAQLIRHYFAFSEKGRANLYAEEEVQHLIDQDFIDVESSPVKPTQVPEEYLDQQSDTPPQDAQQEGIFGNDGGNSVVKEVNTAIAGFHDKGLSDEGEAWLIDHLCARCRVGNIDEIPASKAQEIKEYLRSKNLVGELMDRKYLPKRAHRE